MDSVNLVAGWIGIFAGFLAGAVQGLLFHREHWLGGYASWKRRMLRLGHISFFGIGFINLGFAFTAAKLPPSVAMNTASWLFVAGAVGMPLCCYLSAARKAFRHLFCVPVTSLVAAAAILILKGLLR